MPAAPRIRLIAPDTPTAVLAGFSGGLDSTALLHLLSGDPAIRARGLRAVHVHHGLHPLADAWARHCVRIATGLGVACEVIHVRVDRDDGLGPEASARRARRAAFAQALRPGETLALAHHRDDQAETFLLRALRASGPDGLASMRPWRAFAGGWLWRPLLDTPRAALVAHADAGGLCWIEDASNADTALDRNFLRHRVLPLLRERWAQADGALARAAALAAGASDLLSREDAALLATVREPGDALPVAALRALPAPRRARVLRHWIATLGWPPLPAEGIARIDRDLLGIDGALPAADRMPCFAWHGVSIRRWRDGLHAVDPSRALPPGWSAPWDGSAPLPLPNGDALWLEGAVRFAAPLRVHARRGGERIALPGREGHRTLKHALQEQAVPPWERARMPLLGTAGGVLLAAGDRLRSAAFQHWMDACGAHLRWSRAEPSASAPVG